MPWQGIPRHPPSAIVTIRTSCPGSAGRLSMCPMGLLASALDLLAGSGRRWVAPCRRWAGDLRPHSLLAPELGGARPHGVLDTTRLRHKQPHPEQPHTQPSAGPDSPSLGAHSLSSPRLGFLFGGSPTGSDTTGTEVTGMTPTPGATGPTGNQRAGCKPKPIALLRPVLNRPLPSDSAADRPHSQLPGSNQSPTDGSKDPQGAPRHV